jgi:hypothetical protein
MNDITTENADRFHTPTKELPKNCRILEFAPDFFDALEIKNKNLKLTVGNKYPVLETKECVLGSRKCLSARIGYTDSFGILIKTSDDSGETIWVDDKYFVPAPVGLMHETTVGGFDEATENLAEDKILDSVDIRKWAAEKNVQPLDVPDVRKISAEKTEETAEEKCFKEAVKMAGVEEDTKTKATRRYTKKKFDIHEGVVRDNGNPLINDATACMAAIDRVFGNKTVIEPDGLLFAIKKFAPKLNLTWDNDALVVDGARTKITYNQIQKTFDGLRGLVSVHKAEQIVGRIVAGKLKKVF